MNVLGQGGLTVITRCALAPGAVATYLRLSTVYAKRVKLKSQTILPPGTSYSAPSPTLHKHCFVQARHSGLTTVL